MKLIYLKYLILLFTVFISLQVTAQGNWDTLSYRFAGAMRQPALLLNNGTVLTNSHYYFAKVYDPIDDTIIEYKGHGLTEGVMVKLNNGLVLLSGGWSSGGAHFNTVMPFSLFNPQTNTLSRHIGAYPTKAGHTGTLLNNGNVLLTGGVRNTKIITIINDPYISDTAWLHGQKVDFFTVFDSCYLFHPTDSSFTSTTTLHTARVFHKAVKLSNGNVLVVGGRDKDSRMLKTCELYNPLQASWTFTDSLPIALSRFQMLTLANGDIFLSGGFGKQGASNQCFRYDIANNTWHKLADMQHKRFNHTMTVLSSGKILVTGGANTEVLSSAELYNPQTDTWSLGANMNLAREEHAAVLLNNGELIVIGGINDDVDVRQMEVYEE